MERVIGLGAGGHAKVVIETLRLVGGYEIVGLLDTKSELWNTQVLGVPVLGDDRLLGQLHSDGVRQAFIGLGSTDDTGPRKRLYRSACSAGFDIVTAIHPQSVISPSAALGRGSTVMATAVINAAATLGDNVIVNTGAVVEHDCVIGDHCHVATGAHLASTVNLGNGAHIGAGATVRQCINIGDGAIVAAGAVVVKDVAAGTLVAGVPARPIPNKPRVNVGAEARGYRA